MKVEFREDERGRKFPFIDIGEEDHGKPSFRLWVSGRFVRPRIIDAHAVWDEERQTWYHPKVQDGYEVIFPVPNARIERTQKGSLVMRPHEGSMVYNIMVLCGYRGGADIDVVSLDFDSEDVFRYQEYRSPRGNLGIDAGALVNFPSGEPLTYKWYRTGRLYGKPSEGLMMVMPDGMERELAMLSDELEAIEDLPMMAEQSAT